MVDEAENSRLLAMLGTLYLPLSLAAGILSMDGELAAGSTHFWTFFVAAILLLAELLILAFILRLQIGILNVKRKQRRAKPQRELKLKVNNLRVAEV